MDATVNNKIHAILNEYLTKYIPTQEITHAANEIVKNPTDDVVMDMTRYLMQFDKEMILLQTVNIKPVTNNQIRFAMSEVRKLIAEAKEEEEANKNPSGQDGESTPATSDKKD